MTYERYIKEEISTAVTAQLPEKLLKAAERPDAIIIYKEEGKVLGCLVSYRNNIHPNALYLKYDIDEAVNTSDIYSGLFDQLISIVNEENYIISAETVTASFLSFLVTNRFFEWRRTYKKFFHIDTLNTLYSTAYGIDKNDTFELREKDIETLKRVYEYTHRLNPPKELEVEEWKEIIERNLDKTSSLLLRDTDENLNGYIFIYHGESSQDKKIGECYFKDESAKQLLLQSFAKKLETMKREGVLNILVKSETNDYYASDLFDRLFKRQQADLYTFINTKNINFELDDIEYKDYLTVHNWRKDKVFSEINHWSMIEGISTTKKWWKRIIGQQSESFQRKKINVNGEMVGYVDYYIEGESIEIGIAVGQKEYRDNGLGTVCLNYCAMRLVHQNPSKRVVSITASTNNAAQRMLSKAGFKYESDIDNDGYLYAFERYK